MRRDLKTCDCGEPTDRFSGQCAMCETDEGLFEQLTTNMPEGQKQALLAMDDPVRDALAELLECPASVVQATVPHAGIEAAPPYQVVLDVSVSLTRWKKARAALEAAAPAADAGLIEALDYQVLFDAIAAATSVYANGSINISVQAFREALAANSDKGVV